jgi:hypothetical protein
MIMHYISKSSISFDVRSETSLCVYVGHIEDRICNPRPCCKFI